MRWLMKQGILERKEKMLQRPDWMLNLLQPCNLLIFQFSPLSLSFFLCPSVFLYLFRTAQLIDVNGLLKPGRLSNQTAKRRLYRHRHIEAALATSSKRRVKSCRQSGGVCLSCGCIWIAFAWLPDCLVELVSHRRRRRQRRKINQAWKSSALSTPP